MSGFGGMISFEVKGGHAASVAVLNNLRVATLAASLGSVETLAVNAAANFLHYMTAEEAEARGIATGLIRVSVGIESADDLIADFDQALSLVASNRLQEVGG
jgi:methionine-gamma-lyase